MSSIDVTQYEFEEVSRKAKIKSAVEAMLFASGEPLSLKDLSHNLEIQAKALEEILKEMINDYEDENRGISKSY